MNATKASAALALTMALTTLLSGCTPADPPADAAARSGTAPNEVLTLQPVPSGKLLLTARGEDGVNHTQIEQIVETKFPNIDLVFRNDTSSALDIAHDDLADLYFTTAPEQFNSRADEQLIDLSAQAYLDYYHLPALDSCQIDGHIYYLPGPASLTGIVYDRTLFEQHNWKIPTNLDGFIDLCQQIEQETNLRALQVSSADLDTLCALLSGAPDNTAPALAGIQTLLDAKVIEPSDFEAEAIDSSLSFYRDHGCAMMIDTLSAPRNAGTYGDGKQHELGMMPFPCGNNSNSDYLLAEPSYFVGASKALAEPSSEDKLKAVHEILELLSTPDVQTQLTAKGTPMLSLVRDAAPIDGDLLADCADTISDSRVTSLRYASSRQKTAADLTLSDAIRSFVAGQMTSQQVAAAAAAAHDRLELPHADAGESVGTAATDFTVLETALYTADVFRRTAGTQIGLTRANTPSSGCSIRFYQGNITAGGDDAALDFLARGYEGRLTAMKMTGDNLLRCLNEIYAPSADYPNAYVVASGLKIEFAPWAGDGKRIVSATLADGTPLKPEEIYTVAAWDDTINSARAAETWQCSDLSFTEIMTAALSSDSPISPFHDGRFTLNWSLIDEPAETTKTK